MPVAAVSFYLSLLSPLFLSCQFVAPHIHSAESELGQCVWIFYKLFGAAIQIYQFQTLSTTTLNYSFFSDKSWFVILLRKLEPNFALATRAQIFHMRAVTELAERSVCASGLLHSNSPRVCVHVGVRACVGAWGVGVLCVCVCVDINRVAPPSESSAIE